MLSDPRSGMLTALRRLRTTLSILQGCQLLGASRADGLAWSDGRERHRELMTIGERLAIETAISALASLDRVLGKLRSEAPQWQVEALNEPPLAEREARAMATAALAEAERSRMKPPTGLELAAVAVCLGLEKPLPPDLDDDDIIQQRVARGRQWAALIARIESPEPEH